MEPYIEKWFNIIQGMSNDNTYKLAWGRSIIEFVSINEASEFNQQIEISFQDIAKNILNTIGIKSFSLICYKALINKNYQ